jgi:zinc transport system substrate-binding protein
MAELRGERGTYGPPALPAKILFLLLLFSAFLVVPAGAAPAQDKIPIVASILPLGDFCRQIGGDLVQVEVLIPPGASPHLFEPTPWAVARAAQARVFVYVGAGLDPWAERLLHSREARNVAVVEAVQGIPLLGEAEGKAEAGHHHESGNPHVWLDPVLMEGVCGRIAGALEKVDPAHREVYQANLQTYLKDLQALDREIKARVATFRIREFVSFHPSFSYFARRYGLKELGSIEVSPGREPSPRSLQNLIAAIRRYGVRVVFAEPQFSPRIAQVIAQEAGVKVLTLDPLGGRPPYGGDYLALMRDNLKIMAEAMQ